MAAMKGEIRMKCVTEYSIYDMVDFTAQAETGWQYNDFRRGTYIDFSFMTLRW